MKNLNRLLSVLVLLLLSVVSVLSQTDRQTYRTNDRQIKVILQRLETSSMKFRHSLNVSLLEARIDQTAAGNDINTLEGGFESATYRLRSQIDGGLAQTADIESVLRQASLINTFMAKHRLNRQAQNDWVLVRTNLNSLASAYNISWHWDLQMLPPTNSNGSFRLSDVEVNKLIQRIETGGDKFRESLTEAFGATPYDRSMAEGHMNDAIRGLKNDTDRLRNQFDNKQSINADVDRVLARATPIDTFMRSNRLTNRAQNDWSTLRGDLNTLAGAYSLNANWKQAAAAPVQYSPNSSLTGTFKLDSARSDNPGESADRAVRNLSRADRQSISQRLLARLESPDRLAIERRGLNVTIASSLAPQSTFEADGIAHQEQNSIGRSSKVTATLRENQLVVSSTGYKENDFNVTFDSIENGQRLRVKREIYSARLSQPVVVNSIYDRVSETAQWSVYGSAQPYLKTSSNSSREFILRDGENVIGVLDTDLNSKQAKQGDAFTLTVREPGQYEGAVISGALGRVEEAGRLTGRSGMSLSFDSIKLRNGETYRFAGTLTSVRLASGETVKVDNEGGAQGENQTTQTATRAGIGTVVGAIIGAIAGGGKGAAIGAIIGATGGAGSVYVQGKDDLILPRGTELTIRAGATAQ